MTSRLGVVETSILSLSGEGLIGAKGGLFSASSGIVVKVHVEDVLVYSPSVTVAYHW